MLFVTYWELNEEMSIAERQQIAEKLTSSGKFPPKGVNIIRWDITADNWGVLICEADSAGDMAQALGMWRIAATGVFKVTKTAPAEPVPEAMARNAALAKELGQA